jgi:hypothetical protein
MTEVIKEILGTVMRITFLVAIALSFVIVSAIFIAIALHIFVFVFTMFGINII